MSSRVRSRAWFFTYDNADIGMVAHIRETLDTECKDYVFQMEKSASGMIHFQGVCRYDNPRDNWPDLDCHWERCRNWRSAVKYCTKVDTRIDGPWTNMVGLKFRKTIVDPLYGKELYFWQKKARDILTNTPDSRKIYWLWDSVGNTGKSAFCKHIRMNFDSQILNGTAKDCYCALANRLEDTDIEIILFDLARSQQNRISYTAIESIKNGMFFSGKYESRDIIMNTPHIMVFANFPPDLMMLSQDRWEVWNISQMVGRPHPLGGGGGASPALPALEEKI